MQWDSLFACRTSHFHAFDNIFLAVSEDVANFTGEGEFKYFGLDCRVCYVAFQDDFGPMNLGSVYQFCNIVDEQLGDCDGKNLALLTSNNGKDVTNSVFLLGCYMIMKKHMSFRDIKAVFEPLRSQLLSYCDVSKRQQTFYLHVQDCWGGLLKAKCEGFVSFGQDGSFDFDEYSHYDSPLNADLHEIVPGKLVAMRGPKDLPNDQPFLDVYTGPNGEHFSHRDFSPSHCAELLRDLGVRVVVRLNDPQYDKQVFLTAGLAVADLFFEDCTDPPVDVVAKFLALADALPGALAVHCKAGLGRTGTLAGLLLMRQYGFSAREAMGWLRVVRPGSVIGGQQDFLCAREATMRRGSAARCPLALALAMEAVCATPEEEAAAAARLQHAVDRMCGHFDLRYSAARAALGLESQGGQAGLRRSVSEVADLAGEEEREGRRCMSAQVAQAVDGRTAVRARSLRALLQAEGPAGEGKGGPARRAAP